MNVANDGREVAITDADLAAAGVGTKPALGLMEVFERVATKRPHECFARTRHCVLGVDGFEEEPNRAILGASAISLVLDDRTEYVRVLPVERMTEVTTSSGVDAQEGGDEQRRDVAREHRLLKRWHGGGDAIEHVEQRRQRVLDGSEAALHGGFLRRCAFTLRRMLDADRVVRTLGGRGEVWRALVGDELHPRAIGGGFGDRAGDELAGLTLVDDERIEQAALAITEILDADQLETDAEDAQIGGVAAELGIGRGYLEREATGVAV